MRNEPCLLVISEPSSCHKITIYLSLLILFTFIKFGMRFAIFSADNVNQLTRRLVRRGAYKKRRSSSAASS